MDCYRHPGQPVVGICKHCGKGGCQTCGVNGENGAHGLACSSLCEWELKESSRLNEVQRTIASRYISNQGLMANPRASAIIYGVVGVVVVLTIALMVFSR